MLLTGCYSLRRDQENMTSQYIFCINWRMSCNINAIENLKRVTNNAPLGTSLGGQGKGFLFTQEIEGIFNEYRSDNTAFKRTICCNV
jgi:hypothetical protein